MPTVSIKTSTYNVPTPILAEFWQSLETQTFTDWELVLVDDGSTQSDGIAELDRIAQDPRVTFVRLAENVGTGAARNVALAHCRADLVAIADSDDLLLPDWLASQVAYMDAHPDVHICGCQLESFSHETGKPRGRTNHPPVVTPEVVQAQADAGQIWFINHGGSIYRRDAVLALGGYNPTLRRGQDFDLWMRAHRAGLVIHNQPDVLYRYRRGHQ